MCAGGGGGCKQQGGGVREGGTGAAKAELQVSGLATGSKPLMAAALVI
jgi:hypothetical protein